MNPAAIWHDVSSVIFPPRCLGCSKILNPSEKKIFAQFAKQWSILLKGPFVRFVA